MDSTFVLETERLSLHRLDDTSDADRAFVYRLLNDEAFLRFIGDRGVHEPEQAGPYLRNGPMASYAANGFGLYRVDRKRDGVPVGMCGLVKRDALPGPDLGYALLPEHRNLGYVAEAGAAVLADAHARLGLDTVLAVVDTSNAASIRTLRALGYRWREDFRLPGEDTLLHLFAWTSESSEPDHETP
ncbi:GNAT family N-acetyltransferase [Pseudoxanthomonas indica]|uniref:Protein N-acetyltransferase, RimJ/RimL family n=1 Tax=Pseudoxanthomonas indica TaxID=428993 RepID=A0A1T5LT41_9GAMM|nr:GNAT family N-acetyltransferase [Pseudoxanthomonas indica]GGD39294.1 N-acetyltransferase [Pseudoxanthomonas indica]SKC79177.1 Protein N-acetyltransferase, RimJ/RimL family [Pseudoxanthomonas indica]